MNTGGDLSAERRTFFFRNLLAGLLATLVLLSPLVPPPVLLSPLLFSSDGGGDVTASDICWSCPFCCFAVNGGGGRMSLSVSRNISLIAPCREKLFYLHSLENLLMVRKTDHIKHAGTFLVTSYIKK